MAARSSTNPTPAPREGASIAVIKGRKVLLVRRKRAPFAGLWSLPGGKVERGEAPRDAVSRELKEETERRQAGDDRDFLHRLERRGLLARQQKARHRQGRAEASQPPDPLFAAGGQPGGQLGGAEAGEYAGKGPCRQLGRHVGEPFTQQQGRGGDRRKGEQERAQRGPPGGAPDAETEQRQKGEEADAQLEAFLDQPLHGREGAAGGRQEAAVAMQDAHEGRRLAIKIGIHFGPTLRGMGGDVYGDAVNMAARISSLARPGETLLSGDAVSLLPSKFQPRLRVLDSATFKGKTIASNVYILVPERADGSETMFGTPMPAIALKPSSALLLTHGFIPRLQARGRGGIILVSSVEALIGCPYSAAYSATKALVKALGEGLWAELVPENIDVLTLCPGATESEAAARSGVDPAKLQNVMSAAEVALLALKNLPFGPTFISSEHYRRQDTCL